MIDQLPPPPVPADTPADTTTRSDAATLFVIAAGCGALVGALIGTALGALAMTAAGSNCSPSDGWCGLGAALAGIFVGAVSALVGYVATGVSIIVRRRPSGRRAGAVMAHLAMPLVLFLLLVMLGGLL